MPTGTNRTQLGEHNVKAVIHALRRLGPSSQQGIAAQARLSVQAVSVILRGLTGRGLVREVRSENMGRGRPRIILDLVPEAAYSIGIHIDPSLITAVLLDLAGTPVRTEHSTDVDPADPHASMDVAAGLVHQLMDHTDSVRERIVGSALAVPGRVDLESGAISDSVWLPQWNHAPLSEPLETRIGMRAPLMKDTFAAVAGEIWVRGPELLGATTVFVYFGIGTGLGVAVSGRPVSGETGNAGQAGRLFEILAGSTEQSATTSHDPVALVQAAHERGIFEGAAPERSDIAAVDSRFRSLCSRAAGGDARATELLREAGRRIHQVAAVVADVLDAGVVVLGGPYWPILSGALFADAQREIARTSPPQGPPVTVLSSALGPDAGAIGAASRVLDQHFSPQGGPGAN